MRCVSLRRVFHATLLHLSVARPVAVVITVRQCQQRPEKEGRGGCWSSVMSGTQQSIKRPHGSELFEEADPTDGVIYAVSVFQTRIGPM